jgi:hypothetical protein
MENLLEIIGKQNTTVLLIREQKHLKQGTQFSDNRFVRSCLYPLFSEEKWSESLNWVMVKSLKIDNRIWKIQNITK